VRIYEERDRKRTLPKDSKQPAPPPPNPFNDAARAPTASCDEVSCVLQNYDNGCCDKYRKGGARPRPPTATVPASLDRPAITAGIATVKGRITLCGDVNVNCTVKVRVRVAPAGHVTSVTVDETPEARLGSCVAAAVQHATFDKTQRGGSFSYPFVFTSPSQ
jgi:hypothetical protein